MLQTNPGAALITIYPPNRHKIKHSQSFSFRTWHMRVVRSMASKKKIQPWQTSIQLLMEVISHRFPDLRWAMNPATAGNKLFHVDEAWRWLLWNGICRNGIHVGSLNGILNGFKWHLVRQCPEARRDLGVDEQSSLDIMDIAHQSCIVTV